MSWPKSFRLNACASFSISSANLTTASASVVSTRPSLLRSKSFDWSLSSKLLIRLETVVWFTFNDLAAAEIVPFLETAKKNECHPNFPSA